MRETKLLSHLKLLNASKKTVAKLTAKFATIDFETYTDDDYVHKPYADGVYLNEQVSKEFYITDYNSGSNQAILMMKDCLQFILDYKIKILYAHNAAGYDNILMGQLVIDMSNAGIRVSMDAVREGNTLPVMHITYESHTFTIKDSLKLLPQPLSSLCKSYGIADKGIFPHSFMNVDRLGYVGPKPARISR